MSILKKMKKKYFSINQHQWKNIKEQKQKEQFLIDWKNLKKSLNINL